MGVIHDAFVDAFFLPNQGLPNASLVLEEPLESNRGVKMPTSSTSRHLCHERLPVFRMTPTSHDLAVGGCKAVVGAEGSFQVVLDDLRRCCKISVAKPC